MNRKRPFKIWLHTPSANLPAIFSSRIPPRSLIRMPTASRLPPSQYSRRIFIALDEGDIYVPCHWTILMCFAEAAMDSSRSSCFLGASRAVIVFRAMIMPVGLCLTLCTAPPGASRRRESSSNTSSENSSGTIRSFDVVGNPIRIASSPVTNSWWLSNISVGRRASITVPLLDKGSGTPMFQATGIYRIVLLMQTCDLSDGTSIQISDRFHSPIVL